jgi:hypothetical protein
MLSSWWDERGHRTPAYLAALEAGGVYFVPETAAR